MKNKLFLIFESKRSIEKNQDTLFKNSNLNVISRIRIFNISIRKNLIRNRMNLSKKRIVERELPFVRVFGDIKSNIV